jgi:hypothetical protein
MTQYIYVGGVTTNKVRKLLASDLSFVKDSIDLGGTINWLEQDANYLYVSMPTKVMILQKSDMSGVTVGGATFAGRMILSGTQLYMSELNLLLARNSYNLVPSLTRVIGAASQVLAVDDTYVYYSIYAECKVRKVRKSDFADVAISASLGVNHNVWHGGSNATHLFAVGGLGDIHKLLLADLSITQNAHYDRASLLRVLVDTDNVHAHTSMEASNVLERFHVANLGVDAGYSYGQDIYGIAQDTSFIYLGGTNVRKVHKLSKATYAKVAESASYGGDIMCIVADPVPPPFVPSNLLPRLQAIGVL